jgi:CheY-like chemotaxis protein
LLASRLAAHYARAFVATPVLIIDDSAMKQKLLSSLLRNRGFETETADSSGRAARGRSGRSTETCP